MCSPRCRTRRVVAQIAWQIWRAPRARNVARPTGRTQSIERVSNLPGRAWTHRPGGSCTGMRQASRRPTRTASCRGRTGHWKPLCGFTSWHFASAMSLITSQLWQRFQGFAPLVAARPVHLDASLFLVRSACTPRGACAVVRVRRIRLRAAPRLFASDPPRYSNP